MTNNLDIVVWSKQGCSYCDEIKAYLQEQQISYKTVDVTTNDTFRDILEIKYGVRYIPIVEIGSSETGIYKAVTEIGLEHVQKALAVSLPSHA
ncbi:glutaredoxin family protein [Lysinibacillus cavernae]|uniref:glutaredoxin family protein n=1 Tax=Lysinibacillus cavernae TaxID=2666135 RepID=UPI0012D9C684|nr:glutaredoxin family protein [Lysinibacillus cavernae]